MSKTKKSIIAVQGTEISVMSYPQGDYISLTDMLKAKDGDFFISDWLRNRNTVEFLGIWERVYNPDFNYGEFAIIKSQAGLNSYKISVKEWVNKTHAIGLKATAEQSFKMLRRGGTANIIGMIPVGVHLELHGAEFLGEKRIQGSLMGSNRFPVDMPRLVDFYMSGKLKLDHMISRRIKLNQVNEALDELKRGETARSVIMFDA